MAFESTLVNMTVQYAEFLLIMAIIDPKDQVAVISFKYIKNKQKEWLGLHLNETADRCPHEKKEEVRNLPVCLQVSKV